MAYSFEDDKKELIRFYFNFKNEQESWSDFIILHIHFEESLMDLSSNAQAILESYLQGTIYHIYRPSSHDLYLLYKSRDYDVVAESIQHVESYCAFEKQICYSNWFHLGHSSYNFLDHIEQLWIPSLSINPSLDKSSHYVAKNKKQRNQRTHNGRVLLVEDDPVTRWMVRNTLRPFCLLATASSAHQVFGLYASWRPDLVFLDINLPDGSGKEVLQWIMDNDPLANVVMFSGNNEIETMMETLDEGARGYVTKPFQHDKLLHYLDLFSPQSREASYV